MKPYTGVAMLIALYSLTSVGVYCYSFKWSLFDALCVVTMNLSFFGRATFMTTHETRLMGTVLQLLGNALSVYIFGILVNAEIVSAHAFVQSMKKVNQDFYHRMLDIHQRRLYIPLAQMVVVGIIGTSFFAHNEYWSTSDALCFALMQHVAVGTQGMIFVKHFKVCYVAENYLELIFM
jgi:hypothetical protein